MRISYRHLKDTKGILSTHAKKFDNFDEMHTFLERQNCQNGIKKNRKSKEPHTN